MLGLPPDVFILD